LAVAPARGKPAVSLAMSKPAAISRNPAQRAAWLMLGAAFT